MRCQNCGSTVQDDAVFCDQCGARLEAAAGGEASAPAPVSPPSPAASFAGAAPETSNICPACGTENLPGEMFCSDCGTPLQAPVPEPDLAVEPPAQAATLVPEPAPLQSTAAPAETESATPAVEPTAVEEPTAAPGEVSAGPERLTCASCGADLEPDDRFCHACGAPVEQIATAPAAPAATVPAGTAPTEPSAPAAPAVLTECPACGAHVTPGTSFCEFCGAALVVPAASTPVASVSAPVQATTPASPVTAAAAMPVLVVVETGQALPLTQGTEVLVGREDPYSNVYPDVDLTPYGAEEKGVSRRHFKLTLAEGQYVILDLGSTNYTWVNQQRLQPNVPVSLSNGDEIRAGRLKLVFQTRP